MLRTAEATSKGIHPRTLYALRDRGIIEALDRGLYRLVEHPHSAHFSLAVVARKYPHAVICLISALDWHDLTLEIPRRVQIALPKGAEQPRVRWPPVETFRFSGRALSWGFETQTIDRTPVRIYGPEKTVADCFKFRNKIGTDVAIAALKLCHERRCDWNRLWEAARICRVAAVMRPYLEALAS